MKAHMVLQHLKDSGSFHEGHFVFTSGMHSGFYIDCSGALRDPLLTQRLADAIAYKLFSTKTYVDVIVTPAEGAIPLGGPTALTLRRFQNHNEFQNHTVRSIVASKGSPIEGTKTFVFKRGGGEELKGKNIAVVEDLWSTGSSTKAVIDAVRKCGGNIVAAGAVVNRGDVTAEDIGDVRHFFSLCSVDGVPHSADDCPLCKTRVPMRTDYGHGGKWLKNNPDYPSVI